MTLVLTMLIALFGAGTVFAALYFFLPRQSSVASRMKDLSSGGKTFATDKSLESIFRNDPGILQARLARAGLHDLTPRKLGMKSVVYGVSALCIGLGLLFFTHHLQLLFIDFCVLFALLAAYSPFSSIGASIKKRQTEIARSLPDLLDMLASTVQAGLALNAAFAYAAPSTPGALGEELRAVLSEMRVGRSRAEALKAMADRVDQDDLKTTVRAIIQADRLGSNLSSLLDNLAAEVRQKRLFRAEEQAAQLAVKMVIPMAFFMLPALFVVIFGAVAAGYFAPK
ncbi:MAG: type II secretion system F family protein [Candidatus Baltobacteraceae bacterium]